jgi:hypothetical protein
MAGSKTDYWESEILNIFRGTTRAGVTPYVGLFTVGAGDTGGQTEVSGSNYSRVAVTFGAPSSGSVSNSSTLTFPTPSGSWGTIVGWGIFDASSGGNLLYYSDQSPSQTVGSGVPVKFLSGTLIITETNATYTNFFRDKVLNLLRGTSITGITSYSALFTTAPTASTSGTEATGGSYARTAVTFAAVSGSQITHSADVNFPTPTANWGTILAHGIMDASSGGNLWLFTSVASLVIETGNTVKFSAGVIIISAT